MARYLDLYMDQGATFSVVLPAVKTADGAVVDLSGYTAEAQMSRSYYSSPDKQVRVSATVSNPAQGLITLSLPPTETAKRRPTRWVYDCTIVETATGVRIKVFEGLMVVNPAVSTQSGSEGPTVNRTTTSYLLLRAAISQGGVPALALSAPAVGAPTPVSIEGVNTITGAASFDAGVAESIQDFFVMPADWVTPLDVEIIWRTAATGPQAAVWQLEVSGVESNDPSALIDQSFNSPNSITATAGATSYEVLRHILTGVNVSGVQANGEIMFRFSRRGDDLADTLTVPAELLALRFAIRRNV